MTQAYFKDTFYDDGEYITSIAVWDLNGYISASEAEDKKGHWTELDLERKHNCMIRYTKKTDTYKVTYADPNSAYVVADDICLSMKLYGKHNTAYFSDYYFKVYQGGASKGVAERVKVALFGKLVDIGTNLSGAYSAFSSLVDLAKQARYDKASKQYTITASNKRAKIVASKYPDLMWKQNSKLEAHALLQDIPKKSCVAYIDYQVTLNVYGYGVRTGNEPIEFIFTKKLLL